MKRLFFLSAGLAFALAGCMSPPRESVRENALDGVHAGLAIAVGETGIS